MFTTVTPLAPVNAASTANVAGTFNATTGQLTAVTATAIDGVTLANGNWGYIPDRRSYAEGAYEVESARVPAGTGELLAEAVLAIEMGADAHDLGLTIHAHPTLSETVCFAAEMKEGTITDLYIKKR